MGLTRFFLIMWIAKYKWEWITAILQPIMSFTIFALCYFTVLCLVFRHFFVIDVLLSPAMVALIVKMIATTWLGWSSPTLSTSMISWKIKWNKVITNTLVRQSYGDDTSVQDWNSIHTYIHTYVYWPLPQRGFSVPITKKRIKIKTYTNYLKLQLQIIRISFLPLKFV